ncbi:hypothetical protein [Rubritalea tangerina]
MKPLSPQETNRAFSMQKPLPPCDTHLLRQHSHHAHTCREATLRPPLHPS